MRAETGKDFGLQLARNGNEFSFTSAVCSIMWHGLLIAGIIALPFRSRLVMDLSEGNGALVTSVFFVAADPPIEEAAGEEEAEQAESFVDRGLPLESATKELCLETSADDFSDAAHEVPTERKEKTSANQEIFSVEPEQFNERSELCLGPEGDFKESDEMASACLAPDMREAVVNESAMGELSNYWGAVRMRIASAIHYPAAARRRDIEGAVRVGLSVRPDGTIQNISVTGSPSPLLAAECLAAARRAAPFPSLPQGVDCVTGEITISFRLVGKEEQSEHERGTND